MDFWRVAHEWPRVAESVFNRVWSSMSLDFQALLKLTITILKVL